VFHGRHNNLDVNSSFPGTNQYLLDPPIPFTGNTNHMNQQNQASGTYMNHWRDRIDHKSFPGENSSMGGFRTGPFGSTETTDTVNRLHSNGYPDRRLEGFSSDNRLIHTTNGFGVNARQQPEGFGMHYGQQIGNTHNNVHSFGGRGSLNSSSFNRGANSFGDGGNSFGSSSVNSGIMHDMRGDQKMTMREDNRWTNANMHGGNRFDSADYRSMRPIHAWPSGSSAYPAPQSNRQSQTGQPT
jgi:hypothetical protein